MSSSSGCGDSLGGQPGGRERLGLGLGLGVVVVLGVIVLLVGAARGGEEAEGAGERVLEDAAPGAGRRPGTRGGAAQAEGRSQVLRHVAGVGYGHADRHRVARHRRETSILGGRISRDAAEHFPRGDRDGAGAGAPGIQGI